MSLPGITAPVDAPVFLAAGHSIAESPVFGDVAVGSGHARRRRLWTASERTVAVRWFLEAEQLAAVEAWYEDVLQAGALPWAARVANDEGEGLVWWHARWLSFQAEMLHFGRGIVSGTLFLTGEPSETGPETGVLAMEMRAALVGVPSVVALPQTLAMELVAALEQPVSLRMEIEAALLVYTGASPLPEGAYADLERIWVRLSRSPVAGNEIDRSVQELVQRAWMRW